MRRPRPPARTPAAHPPHTASPRGTTGVRVSCRWAPPAAVHTQNPAWDSAPPPTPSPAYPGGVPVPSGTAPVPWLPEAVPEAPSGTRTGHSVLHAVSGRLEGAGRSLERGARQNFPRPSGHSGQSCCHLCLSLRGRQGPESTRRQAGCGRVLTDDASTGFLPGFARCSPCVGKEAGGEGSPPPCGPHRKQCPEP